MFMSHIGRAGDFHVAEQNLPLKLLAALGKAGVTEGEILFPLACDLDAECAWRTTYLCLCADRLAVARAGKLRREKIFSGYGKILIPEEEKYTVTVYPLDQIDRVEIQELVVGGLLLAGINGVETGLAACTGGVIGDARRFCAAVGACKRGEQPTDHGLPDEREEEYCPRCGALYPDRNRKICPKCMDKKGVFLRVLSYFSAYKGKIALMMLMFVLTAVLNLVYPYLNGTVLYDRVLGGAEVTGGLRFVTTLGGVVAAMVVSKILLQLVGVVHSVLTAVIVPDVVHRIRSDVFDSMGRLSISFYSNRQTGGLMTRVLDDTNEVTSFFVDGLPYFFTNAFTIVSTVAIMLAMDWRLAVVSLILLPVMPIVSFKMLPRLWHLYGKRHRVSRSLNGQINDNITGARVVKAFGQEENEEKRFSTYNQRVRTAELNIVAYDNRFNALYRIVQNLASFAVWGFGSMLVLGDQGIELGVLITFSSYVTQLNGPLNFMSQVFRWWASSTNASQRIFEIIDAIPEVTEPEDPVPLPQMKGEIELKNVTFGYEPNRDVLQNINLHLRPGEMLGIVGRSGAGKSTLVNLINRLYDPKEGDILIDGVNIRNMAFSDFRSGIAMVSQETYIFMGTVEENIAYAKKGATHDEVVAAAVAASAHDFICKMPDGYDTVIGSSGRSLSGGERQRISIARAILANPRILILDEATASVDTETEMAIQASLDRLVKGRTTISIAHRLSTLRGADRLIVIDDGRITESGTHRELIERRGVYFKLMQLQSKALAMRGIE